MSASRLPSVTSSSSATARGPTEYLIRLGRFLFAGGIAAIGALSLLYSELVVASQPVPSGIPARLLGAALISFILVACGASLLADRRGSFAAAVLGSTLGLGVLLLHAPTLARRPSDPDALTAACQTLALCGAAWVLWGTLRTEGGMPPGRGDVVRMLTSTGRVCFGVAWLVFGILHFVCLRSLITLVPAWIPGRPFWVYLAGAAFVAAGVSIVVKVQARLAALLLGIVLGGWVLIVRWPRVVDNLRAQDAWTSLFVAIAMCGAAWLVADHLATEEASKASSSIDSPARGLAPGS